MASTPSGTRRKLFKSPVQSPSTVRRRADHATTTTTIPLRETGEDELTAAVTPSRRRGRPRLANGTPAPQAGVKRRAVSPISRNPRRVRTERLGSRGGEGRDNTIQLHYDEGKENFHATPATTKRGRPPKAHPAQPSSEAGTTKRGRRRQAMAPDELVGIAEEAAAERSQLQSGRRTSETDAVDLIQAPPSRQHTENNTAQAADAASNADSDSDSWIPSRNKEDNEATPRATTQPSSLRLPSESDHDNRAPEASDHSTVDEHNNDYSSQTNDTIAQGEDFSMIFMDSLPSLQGSLHGNSSFQPTGDDDDVGDDTHLIINNTLASLRREVAQTSDPVDVTEQIEIPEVPEIEDQPEPEPEFVPIIRESARNARLSLSPWWSRKPKKMGATVASPLRHQTLLRSAAKRSGRLFRFEHQMEDEPTPTKAGKQPSSAQSRRGGSNEFREFFSENSRTYLDAAAPRPLNFSATQDDRKVDLEEYGLHREDEHAEEEQAQERSAREHAEEHAEGDPAEEEHAQEEHDQEEHAQDEHAQDGHAQDERAEEEHAQDERAEEEHVKEEYAEDEHVEGTYAEEEQVEEEEPADDDAGRAAHNAPESFFFATQTYSTAALGPRRIAVPEMSSPVRHIGEESEHEEHEGHWQHEDHEGREVHVDFEDHEQGDNGEHEEHEEHREYEEHEEFEEHEELEEHEQHEEHRNLQEHEKHGQEEEIEEERGHGQDMELDHEEEGREEEISHREGREEEMGQHDEGLEAENHEWQGMEEEEEEEEEEEQGQGEYEEHEEALERYDEQEAVEEHEEFEEHEVYEEYANHEDFGEHEEVQEDGEESDHHEHDEYKELDQHDHNEHEELDRDEDVELEELDQFDQHDEHDQFEEHAEEVDQNDEHGELEEHEDQDEEQEEVGHYEHHEEHEDQEEDHAEHDEHDEHDEHEQQEHYEQPEMREVPSSQFSNRWKPNFLARRQPDNKENHVDEETPSGPPQQPEQLEPAPERQVRPYDFSNRWRPNFLARRRPETKENHIDEEMHSSSPQQPERLEPTPEREVQPVEATPPQQMSSPLQDPQSVPQDHVQYPVLRPVLSSIMRAGRVLQTVTSDPPSPREREKQLRSPFRSSASKEPSHSATEGSQPPPSKSPPQPFRFGRDQSAANGVTANQRSAGSGLFGTGFGSARPTLGASAREPLNRQRPPPRESVTNSLSNAPPRGGTTNLFARDRSTSSGFRSNNPLPQPSRFSDIRSLHQPLPLVQVDGAGEEPDRFGEEEREEDQVQVQESQFEREEENQREEEQEQEQEQEQQEEEGQNEEEEDDDDDDIDLWEYEAQREVPPRPVLQQPPMLMTQDRDTAPGLASSLRDAQTSSAAVTAPRALPNASRTQQTIGRRPDRDLEADESPLLSRKQPQQAPATASKSKGFDLSSFFSSPAALPGLLADKFKPIKPIPSAGRTDQQAAAQEEEPPTIPTTSLFPSLSQTVNGPQNLGRTAPPSSSIPSIPSDPPVDGQVFEDASSPATSEERDLPTIAQKQNFAPRPRQANESSFFQPSSSQLSTSPTRMQLTHEDIERWQLETSNAGEDSPSLKPLLRPLPPRHASPKKSNLRSPLKPHTPGRVVEFSGSVLSPEEQARLREQRLRANEGGSQEHISTAAAVPNHVQPRAGKGSMPRPQPQQQQQKQNPPPIPAPRIIKPAGVTKKPPVRKHRRREPPSQTVWTRQHWIFLDTLLQMRRQRPFSERYAPVSQRYLGKVVTSMGESLVLEKWHLECIDAFKSQIKGWDEGELAKRLFALILGEAQRRRTSLGQSPGVMFH